MRKAEFSKIVVTKELFKKFLEEFPEHKDMTWDIFYKSWLEIAEKIRYEAVNNPLGVKLGSYTGELKVQYIPYKMDIIDHAASEEHGEEVHHFNFDSKGKPARVKWERRWAARFNKVLQFYAFDETRELTEAAGEYIVKNPNSIRVARVTVGGKPNIWTKKR
jgi:hypothetical protein